MDDLCEDLCQGLMSQNREVVGTCLETVLQGELVVGDEIIIKSLYIAMKNHVILSKRVCEVIAFLAKDEKFRKHVASFQSLISLITPLLLSSDIETRIQALRAIGNVCHDEDNCRQQFLLQDGHLLLMKLLRQCLHLEGQMQFKTIVSGCLLNFSCQNEKISHLLLDLGAIELLSLLLFMETDFTVISMSLQAISVLIEADCFDIEYYTKSYLLKSLMKVFSMCCYDGSNTSIKIMEQILEIFETTLSDENASLWREAMVDSGCVLKLLHLDGTKLKVKVYNIIIQVTASDKAVKSLFSCTEMWTSIIKDAKNAQLSPSLRASAVCVIANFARSDVHCKDLIQKNVVPELVCMMDEKSKEETVKFNYAIMSTLRNLAIPDCSKDTFFQKEILDKIVAVLNTASDPNVLMKAVGCMRLLSKHNNICTYLTVDNSVVVRVVTVCDMFNFPHIKIEGSRLLASLIKNHHDKDSVLKVINDGGTQSLLYLLKTDYSSLKNEGIVALTIAASMQQSDALVKAVLNSDTINSFLELLQDSQFEVADNCLTLLQVLCLQSDSLKIMFNSCELLIQQLEILSNHENISVVEKATKLLQLIKECA